MKGIYKKQIWEYHTSYNEFEGKPMIESITVEGDHQSDYYNIYNKDQVNDLIKNVRSVRIVPTKPADPMKNTMYYVGANPPYDVYFYTSVRKEIYMGKTGAVMYTASEGLELTPSLDIRLLYDNNTLEVNTHNELVAKGRLYPDWGIDLDPTTDTLNVILAPESSGNRLAINSNNQLYMQVFEAATDDSEGKHGAVPAPTASDTDKYLTGDVTWKEYSDKGLVGEVRVFAAAPTSSDWMLCDGRSLSSTAYPELFKAIGTAYGGSGSNFNIPNLVGKSIEGAGDNVRTMKNGQGKYDTITSDLQVGDELEAGMPNVTGYLGVGYQAFDWNNGWTGAFYKGGNRAIAVNNNPGSSLLVDGGRKYLNFTWQNGNGVWSTTNPDLQFNSISMPYYIRVK